jgi:small subunit ribosomal protein S13
MFKYNDKNFPINTRVINSFSSIFGIGIMRVSQVMSILGVGRMFIVNLINGYYFDFFIKLIKQQYIFAERLTELIEQRIKFFLEIKMVKGVRLSKGLPVRGQRTHSNGNSQINVKNKMLGIETDNKWFMNRNKMKRSVIE